LKINLETKKYSLLYTTQGYFRVGAENIIYRGPDNHRLLWRGIESELYLYRSAGITSGWVHFRPPQIPHVEIEEISNPPQMEDNKPMWVKIKYKAIEIDIRTDPSESPYAGATVGPAEAFFYSGLDGRLRLINQDRRVGDPHMNGCELLN
jgi:hypothetical protein